MQNSIDGNCEKVLQISNLKISLRSEDTQNLWRNFRLRCFCRIHTNHRTTAFPMQGHDGVNPQRCLFISLQIVNCETKDKLTVNRHQEELFVITNW